MPTYWPSSQFFWPLLVPDCPWTWTNSHVEILISGVVFLGGGKSGMCLDHKDSPNESNPRLDTLNVEILVPSVVALGWGFGMYLNHKGGHNGFIIFTVVLMHL